jgi:UDP-N-acetylglucosamine transferase subunit ALG13
MKIYATVGTADWDPLIQALDEQVAAGLIEGTVVAQIGRGRYRPTNFRHFKIADEETHYLGLDWADLIISTGGSGTLMESLVSRKKKMILVWMRPWSPQAFRPFIDGKHVLYCEHLEDLHLYIQKAKTFDFRPFEPERLTLDKVLEGIEDDFSMHPVEKCCGVWAITGLLIFFGYMFYLWILDVIT